MKLVMFIVFRLEREEVYQGLNFLDEHEESRNVLCAAVFVMGLSRYREIKVLKGVFFLTTLTMAWLVVIKVCFY